MLKELVLHAYVAPDGSSTQATSCHRQAGRQRHHRDSTTPECVGRGWLSSACHKLQSKRCGLPEAAGCQTEPPWGAYRGLGFHTCRPQHTRNGLAVKTARTPFLENSKGDFAKDRRISSGRMAMRNLTAYRRRPPEANPNSGSPAAGLTSSRTHRQAIHKKEHLSEASHKIAPLLTRIIHD